jgi:hypothetical protein
MYLSSISHTQRHVCDWHWINIHLYVTLIYNNTDHDAQFLTISYAATNKIPLKQRTRLINSETLTNLQTLLKQETWDAVYQNQDANYSKNPLKILKIQKKFDFLSGKCLKRVGHKNSYFFIFSVIITYICWSFIICNFLQTFSPLSKHLTVCL